MADEYLHWVGHEDGLSLGDLRGLVSLAEDMADDVPVFTAEPRGSVLNAPKRPCRVLAVYDEAKHIVATRAMRKAADG